MVLALPIIVANSCGRGSDDPPSGPGKSTPVAAITVSAPSATLPVGRSMVLTAVPRSASGAALRDRVVTWTSSNSAVAAASDGGAVTGIAQGTATITASAEGRSATAMVTVVASAAAAGDFAIVGAVWTQGVQTEDGSFPMVMGGAAVVNVLLRATGTNANAAPGHLVLVVQDAAGTMARADTILPTAPGEAPTLDAPSAHLLVPAAVLRPGLRWRVLRDPHGVARDDSAANGVFPRSGSAPLQTVELPTLKIRFVPISLAAYSSATGNVAASNVEDYLRTVRSVLPAGRIDPSVQAPLATGASFGTPPSGGARAFWIQVLQELDLVRIASGEPDAYWYGVVRPPAGFNRTLYGGWAYVPVHPGATGPATRTAAGVQTNWFVGPTQARDLVAHEIAHNLGRRHAPCGGTDAPLDPAYPSASGVIGAAGHDVHSWATGRTTTAPTVPATQGDVMGYCFPVWSSHYSYEALLAARAVAGVVLASGAPARGDRVLVVRGQVDGGRLTLLPAVALTGHAGSEQRGAFRVEAIDAQGVVIAARRFSPSAIDHAAVELFTVALPVDADDEARLAQVRVVAPRGSTARSTPHVAGRDSRGPMVARAATRRVDGDRSHVGCADRSAQATVVTDAATGAVLASARGSSIALATRATSLRVACSDGVRTTTSVVR